MKDSCNQFNLPPLPPKAYRITNLTCPCRSCSELLLLALHVYPKQCATWLCYCFTLSMSVCPFAQLFPCALSSCRTGTQVWDCMGPTVACKVRLFDPHTSDGILTFIFLITTGLAHPTEDVGHSAFSDRCVLSVLFFAIVLWGCLFLINLKFSVHLQYNLFYWLQIS
jgi:hypothetical protein